MNLAARVEGLTGTLSKRLLLSQAFALAAREATREVGDLKGVAGPTRVFEPANAAGSGYDRC